MREIAPGVAIAAHAHFAPSRVEGAGLPSGTLGQVAKPGGGEVESCWRRFVWAVCFWTRVFVHHKPWDIFLANIGVRTISVRAVVLGSAIKQVVAAHL